MTAMRSLNPHFYTSTTRSGPMITWAYERHMNIPCNFTHGSPHSLTIEGGAHKPTNKQKKTRCSYNSVCHHCVFFSCLLSLFIQSYGIQWCKTCMYFKLRFEVIILYLVLNLLRYDDFLKKIGSGMVFAVTQQLFDSTGWHYEHVIVAVELIISLELGQVLSPQLKIILLLMIRHGILWLAPKQQHGRREVHDNGMVLRQNPDYTYHDSH